jgi:hypothetical protein
MEPGSTVFTILLLMVMTVPKDVMLEEVYFVLVLVH